MLGANIFVAAKAGDMKRVQQLVEKQPALIRATSRSKGATPLVKAANNGKLCVVEYLLQQGADVNAASGASRWTALHSAAFRGDMIVMQFLLKQGGINVNPKDSTGETPLHKAAEKRNVEALCCLLDSGADASMMNQKGETLLHWAASHGKMDIVQLILDKRAANIDARNGNGDTVSHWAASRGNVDIVQYVLERGANANALNQKQNSLLHEAVKHRSLDMLRHLFDKGAEPNSPDKEGNTPLHHAALLGKPEKDLKPAKIRNPQTSRPLFSTPTLPARPNSDTKSDINDRERNTQVIWCLLENGANINARNKIGRMPLHLAVAEGALDMVKCLLESGADVNAKDTRGGETPMHMAAHRGHLGMVRILSEKGANIDSRDKKGLTALHHGACAESLDVVKHMLESGADVFSTNHGGNTPLDMVRSQRSNEAGLVSVVEHLARQETKLTYLAKHYPLRAGIDAEMSRLRSLVVTGSRPNATLAECDAAVNAEKRIKAFEGLCSSFPDKYVSIMAMQAQLDDLNNQLLDLQISLENRRELLRQKETLERRIKEESDFELLNHASDQTAPPLQLTLAPNNEEGIRDGSIVVHGSINNNGKGAYSGGVDTLCRSKDGTRRFVGHLKLPHIANPMEQWPMCKETYVYVAHTGQDGVKDDIARPTKWFLERCLNVNYVFLDDESAIWGSSKLEALVPPAYKCTHALVILSPTFIMREFCVMELNTFMNRYRATKQPHRVHEEVPYLDHDFCLLPALWRLDNLDDYHQDLKNIIRVSSDTHYAPTFMIHTLWPKLCDVLGFARISEFKLKQHLLSYIDRKMELSHFVPSDLRQFYRDNKSEHPSP